MPLQKTFCSCGLAIPRQQGWLQYIVPLDSVASPRHTARPEAKRKFVVLAQKENGDNIQLDMDETNSHWHLLGLRVVGLPRWAQGGNIPIAIRHQAMHEVSGLRAVRQGHVLHQAGP